MKTDPNASSSPMYRGRACVNPGLTKREYFALELAKALATRRDTIDWKAKDYGANGACYADALIAALKGEAK